MSVKIIAAEVLNNPKVAVTVASTTMGTGLGTILDLIPDDVGKLTTLVGGVLSVVIIYNVLTRLSIERKQAKLENQKTLLEVRALQAKETERERLVEEFVNGADRRKEVV
jgi:hypothetical protein